MKIVENNNFEKNVANVEPKIWQKLVNVKPKIYSLNRKFVDLPSGPK